MSAKLIHEFACLMLLVEYVGFYLVYHWRNLHVGRKIHQMVREEVAHADGTKLACLVSLFQVSIGSVAVAERLVQEHQVDVVGLQFAQTLIDALHSLSLTVV